MPLQLKWSIVMDWDKLRIFRAVATEGSLTRAGLTLNLHQSAVSRQVKALEDSLSAKLFHRHARGLLLTEQGELLLDATESMAKQLEFTAAKIRDSKEEVFGTLRVTTTIGFGTLWLAPRLKSLYRRHPDFTIELMLEERILDLPMREADFAIRMKEPSQADLIRRKLMTVRMGLYATEEYLERFGSPNSLKDLKSHRLICQNFRNGQGAGARFIRSLIGEGISVGLTVNNYYGVLQGVIHHLGVGALPDYLLAHHAELIPVLPDLKSTDVPVYLAYPVELRNFKRIRTFRDFILEQAAEYGRIDRAIPQGPAATAES